MRMSSLWSNPSESLPPSTGHSFPITALWPDASEEEAVNVEERLEDYLDHLSAPLLGVLPYRKRQEVRREVRTHLEMLIEEYAAAGHSPSEAVESALREYGSPVPYGEDMVEALSGTAAATGHLPAVTPTSTQDEISTRRSTPPVVSGPLRALGRPPVVAFVCFGIALLVSELLLQVCFGVPRMQWLFSWTATVALLGPLVAGLLTGWLAPNRAASGTLRAFGLLLPQAALAGLLFLPDRSGLLFALGVAVYWLPMGLLAAVSGEALARYIRLRRLWKEMDAHAAPVPSYQP
jgi:hypothetical protein